jgi:hypothetical protein
MARMLRNTFVPTEGGITVMVSTCSKGGMRFVHDYETLVFPVVDGKPVMREIREEQDSTAKAAKRTHRTLCQQLDVQHRPYVFSQKDNSYIPVNSN